ncbi:HNH endonuclease [Nordella sp. HKS 07]|uniref:HNH endonuclease n=1 Tax=Nordella sp. HKS 07 TaxID=2712222 RepID=UPI0013E18A8F|nr:HNH endonuclease [Nordella sp. HKS 07]
MKKAAKARAGDNCEQCGLPFAGRRPEYDHILPDGLGGEPTLENCAVLCPSCYRIKTHTEDRLRMQKADNIAKKNDGLKRKFPWPKQRRAGCR